MASPVIQFKRGNLANLPALQAGEPAFTVDSFDLFVGIDSSLVNNKFFGSHRYWNKESTTSGSSVNLVEGTSNGSNYISLKSPDSLAGVTTYVLPSTPTADFFLKTDENGNLSWGAVSQSTFAGIVTFTDTTENTLGDADTGAVQIDGGLGVNKNVTVGGNLNVQGYSEFVGVVTFQGGTINLGNSDEDDINVAGEFVSNLIPNQTDAYDLGNGDKKWRNINISGVHTNGGLRVLGEAHVGSLTVDSDVNVSGNVTIGGTTLTVSVQTLNISDPDIILGVTTASNGDDLATDTTANHGGIAIASTEGYPLVDLTVAGIETLPPTYKKFMWFKEETFAGLGTDAWLSNYAIGIGSTQFPSGTRLAAGNVQITNNDIAGVRNFNASGVGTFGGSLYVNGLEVTGGVSIGEDIRTRNLSVTGVSTFAGAAEFQSDITSIGNINSSGIITATTFDGNIALSNVTGFGTEVSTFLATPSSDLFSQLLPDETGNGSVVFSNSPVLVTPSLGDASADSIVVGGAVTANSTGVNVAGVITATSFDGNLALANITGLGANVATFLATPSSSNLASAVTDETGSGSLVFANTPTLITPILGDATATTLITSGDVVVGTAMSAPTVRTATITHSGGTEAATIDSSGNIVASQNLTVTGNLFVNGSTTQVNTSSMTIEDRTIELGLVDGSAPATATTWDLGVLFNYNSSGAKKSAVLWEHADGRFKFGSQVTDGGGTDADSPQITVSNYAAIEVSSIWVNDCAGQSQLIDCSGGVRTLQNITIDGGSF